MEQGKEKEEIKKGLSNKEVTEKGVIPVLDAAISCIAIKWIYGSRWPENDTF